MAAIATAKRKAVPGIATLRVPPAEILIAMKLDSASDPRRKPSRATQDLADAQSMLETSRTDERAILAELDLVSPRARKLYKKLKKSPRPWTT